MSCTTVHKGTGSFFYIAVFLEKIAIESQREKKLSRHTVQGIPFIIVAVDNGTRLHKMYSRPSHEKLTIQFSS